MSIEVALVEDNDQLRNWLQVLINGSQGFVCRYAFSNAEKAVSGLIGVDVDVVLMDISLKQGAGDGIWCTKQLKGRNFRGQILVLSIFEDEERIFQALQAGAKGYLLKNTQPSILLDCIRDIHAGGSPMTATIARRVVNHFQKVSADLNKQNLNISKLSKRESVMLDYIMQGWKYSEIARELSITESTVKGHARRIFEKLEVDSRSHLMSVIARHNIVNS
jgi:DNA-binding NarL/FixJ family response regulator